jgi:hypothetical protein
MSSYVVVIKTKTFGCYRTFEIYGLTTTNVSSIHLLLSSSTSDQEVPTYHAQQLYATHAGQRPLKTRMGGPPLSDPTLDPSARISEDGRALALFGVNHSTEARTVTVDLAVMAPLDQNVQVWTLGDRNGAGERDALNY